MKDDRGLSDEVVDIAISIFALCLFLAMQGCAVKKSEVDRSVDRTNRRIAEEMAAPRDAPAVVMHEGGRWLAGHEMPLDQPSSPEIRQRVRLGTAAPASLREIAQRIAQVTRIPTGLEPDLQTASSPAGAILGTPPQLGFPALPALPAPSGSATLQNPNLPGFEATSATNGNDPLSLRIAYAHDGPLDELLDQIAARFGIAWEYKAGRIALSRFATKVFALYLPAEIRTVEAEVGGKAKAETISAGGVSTGGASANGGGLGGGNGGTGSSQTSDDDGVGQSVKSEAKLETWKEVENAIQRMLTPAGKVSVSPSSGDIVVTDTPAAIKRVGDYVDQKNASLTRQVAVQVDVLSVENDRSEDFEIQWQALFKNEDLGMTLITPDLVTGATANLAMQLLRPKSDFKGTQTVVKALSSALGGRVVTSSVATTLNNHPAPIQVTRSDGYLRSVSTTVSGLNGVVSTTLQPGQITTGFLMTVTPRILDRDRLLLSYNIDLSRLLSFTEATAGAGDNRASIKIPNFERRAFIQAVSVKAGDTLVLSGFEQVTDSANLSGPVFPENSLFGSRRLEKNRARLVILITPALVGNGAV